jgi:hypothetical protein
MFHDTAKLKANNAEPLTALERQWQELHKKIEYIDKDGLWAR